MPGNHISFYSGGEKRQRRGGGGGGRQSEVRKTPEVCHTYIPTFFFFFFFFNSSCVKQQFNWRYAMLRKGKERERVERFRSTEALLERWPEFKEAKINK